MAIFSSFSAENRLAFWCCQSSTAYGKRSSTSNR
jgi:hypothetical protein